MTSSAKKGLIREPLLGEVARGCTTKVVSKISRYEFAARRSLRLQSVELTTEGWLI